MTSARPTHCPRCGQKVSPTVGECFFCDPEGPGPDAPVPDAPAEAGSGERAALDVDPDGLGAQVVANAEQFSLLLFEAEEMLARGHGDRALVLASRAVRERPDNLTALALYERARRDVLKGRRREKLEARIAEGRALFAAGRFAEAERIVNSALKLLPDHLLALQLHALLKERRLGAGTVEAEAERELDRMAHAQSARSAQAARAALANGWYRRALVAVRRGLRLWPDDPELLDVLREIQRSDQEIERETARRRAVLSRVRVALDLLGHDRIDESLKILRAVLREEPDDARAQAAIQDVRRVWLQRHAPPLDAPPVMAAPAPPPPAASTASAHSAARPEAPPSEGAGAEAAHRMASARAAGGGGRTVPGVHVQRPASIPQEILLPRTRRRATPLALVLAGAGVALAVVYLLVGRSAPAPAATAPPPTAIVPTTVATPPPPGPLDGIAPDLRSAIESTLADYARALESRDPDLLARVRPDLPAAARAALLAPFAGAINVGVDLRVLDVVVQGERASVPVLHTDVIVGGSSSQTAPVEEVLRFQRGAAGWALDAAQR